MLNAIHANKLAILPVIVQGLIKISIDNSLFWGIIFLCFKKEIFQIDQKKDNSSKHCNIFKLFVNVFIHFN